MRYWGWEDWAICVGLPCLVTVLIVALGVAIYWSSQDDNRLMAQCLADGKKEYECRAMLKQDVVPMPIVIPIR